MQPLAREEIERFRGAVAERMGLSFDEGKADMLAEALRKRLDSSGVGLPEAYLDRLTAWPEEWRALAERLTVTETYLFRYAEQFRAFAEVVLPEAMARKRGGDEVVLLSAGCASGEEAYTLAILADGRPVRVVGIDVNPAMIARARQGRCSAWALRDAPAEVLARWFRADAYDFVLDEAMRRRVTFEERNLLDDDPAFWKPDAFDAIFCRNVIMYMTAAAARSVVARLSGSLRPDGHLFLGHAETLRGLSDAFHLCHTHETFYYRRKDVGVAPATQAAARPAFVDTTWVEAIRRASERIASLSGGPGAPPARAGGWDLGAALELVRRERFVDALEAIAALPPESGADGEVLLLRAAILTNSGGIAEAERVCRGLLEADDLNAGAHYLMALCRERAGDPAAAVEHDRTAAYLDPTFAMPRLHLGLMARRRGDAGRARAELSAALELLAREEPSRLLLFGGGFGRDGLAGLCRSELAACGGGS
jgi:chemotaxis protein methyltransferase CheR